MSTRRQRKRWSRKKSRRGATKLASRGGDRRPLGLASSGALESKRQELEERLQAKEERDRRMQDRHAEHRRLLARRAYARGDP